ncbi:G patch domain-containing protein 11-like [Pocillopora damicornis]|uniref:G patch domain-containing protein 11-like n=1 Tax=Pocillopora damicornis TaxID=46731 RepID=UPI000F54E120|nr:G patch domain-containing protein 11-like [Pocillopora damicornis]
MADEDEEDYMSDKFLLSTTDNNPGLVPDKVAKKYRREMKHKELNQRNKMKPMREREMEHREQGLANALDSSNKGFAMLQKMGFKKGMGLGKEGTGRAEPIPLTVKADRGGLGRDMLLKRQREVKEALKHETAKKRVKIEEKQRDNFRKHMSGRFAERQTSSDLYKSQKACEQLDKSKDLPCVEKWFWPQEETKEDDENKEEDEEENDEEEEEELEPSEKLMHLTMYLRRTHQYCIWCGTKFLDDQDMADNCPGDSAQDHE